MNRPSRVEAHTTLFAFCLVVGASQLCWLTFAPLLTWVQSHYGLGEFGAGSLLYVFPLLYLLLSVHAGAMIDRRGYRLVVKRAAAATALFALLRMYTDSFPVLWLAHVGLAAAQPYVVNAIPKIVATHYDERDAGAATGLCAMAMYAGMALGLAGTPLLSARIGQSTTVGLIGVAAGVCAVIFGWLAKEPANAGPTLDQGSARGFGELLRDGQLLGAYALGFGGLGLFNGLTTWLEAIVADNGFDSGQAGLAGGLLVLGGMLGSAVVPALGTRFVRRKPLLTACGAVSVPLVHGLCTTSDPRLPYLFAPALGFCFLPTYALMLEICGELAGPASAGRATGLFMLAGNAGAVVITVAMPLLNGETKNHMPSVWLLVACAVAITALTRITPDRARAAAAGEPSAGAADMAERSTPG